MSTTDSSTEDLEREAHKNTFIQQLRNVGSELNGGTDPTVVAQALRSWLDDFAAAQGRGDTIKVTLAELTAQYWEQQQERVTAAPTGFGTLDSVLGNGLMPGKLVCLLGAPGSGKTSLANQIAEHIASSGRPVVYVTTEDPPLTLLHKTMARVGNLDYGDIQRGTKAKRQQIEEALQAVAARDSGDRLLYLDRYDGMESLRAVAQAHFKRYMLGGRGLIVADYLQRIARSDMTGKQDLRQAVGAMADRLRQLARELDCSVLALASQNRAGYNGDNSLASAKESGDVEYSADVLMALSHVKEPKRDVPPDCEPYRLDISKNRQGRVAKLPLDWRGDRQRFIAVAQGVTYDAE